jgi:hypothetical protein
VVRYSDEAFLRAIEQAFHIDQVLALDGRLLLRRSQPGANVGGWLRSVPEIGQRCEVTSLSRGGAVPPASMKPAIELILGDASADRGAARLMGELGATYHAYLPYV